MPELRPKSFVKPCPAAPQLHALDGITMNAAVAGNGRPIVFIHGIGWDHTLWGSAMARFADRYMTIAGDSRGHGATDKPDGPYSIDDFAGDWAQLIAALTDQKVLIVGFSLGGMIAQTLALRHPEMVGALVLVNTSCRSPSAGSAHMRERAEAVKREGPAAAAMLAARSVFSQAWRDTHPAALAEFVEWRSGHDHRALGHAGHAASNFDLGDRVHALAVPTLVITAAGDELMPPADQASLTQLIPGAEYAEIADSGHMLPVEQAEALESVLEGFLQKHWPADGSEDRSNGPDKTADQEERVIRGSAEEST